MPEWQERISRQLKAARVVFGTYRVDGDKVILRATVLNVLEDKPVATVVVKGSAQDVLKLEKQLAGKVLGILTGRADAEAFVAKLPVWTDSVPASKLLYQGVYHFDYGRYEEAWLHFRRALRRDATYADARYWAARMFYYQLRYAHALADLESFLLSHPNHPRAGDALMESMHAVILGGASVSDVVGYCRRMLPQAKEVQLHCPVAGVGHVKLTASTYLHLCLGELYSQMDNAGASAEHLYRAWLDTSVPEESRREIRSFFNYVASRLPRPPDICGREIIRITRDKPWHEVIVRKEDNRGMPRGIGPEFHLGWFACDEDHFIDSVYLTLSHKIKFGAAELIVPCIRRHAHCREVRYDEAAGVWRGTTRDFLPAPMTQHIQIHAGVWTGHLKDAPGTRCRLDFRVLPKSRASARLRIKVIPKGPLLPPYGIGGRSEGPWVFRPGGVIPNLLVGRDHRLILWAAAFGDIWISTSDDHGDTWTHLTRLPCPVSSAHWETSPSLILDRRGRYVLVFLSDRNILRRFWPYVCFSEDLVNWTRPAKISELVSQTVHLIQDLQGQYLLTQGTMKGGHVTRSADGLDWRAPVLVWRDKSDGHRPALDSGVAQAALFQWPDGQYQLLLVRNQRVKYYSDPSSSAYTWGGGMMLFTARSSDRRHWKDWHLLSTSPSGALPNHCHVPGVGLVFHGCFADSGLRSGEIERRRSRRYAWIKSGDGTQWTAHSGALINAAVAIARTSQGRLVGVRADMDELEQLPTFSFFHFQDLSKLLARSKAQPLVRKQPVYGSLIVRRTPKSQPGSQPAGKP